MSCRSLIHAVLFIAICTPFTLGFTPFRKASTPEQLRELGIAVTSYPREGSDEQWLEIRFDSSKSRQCVDSFEVLAHFRHGGKRIALAESGRTNKGKLRVVSNNELKNERSYFGITVWKKKAGETRPSKQVIQIGFGEFSKLSLGQKPRNAKPVPRPQIQNGESTKSKMLMLTPGRNRIVVEEPNPTPGL